VICELLIFYEATKGLFVGMGDPPGIIYPDRYGFPHLQPDIRIPTVSYGYHGMGMSLRSPYPIRFTHCHLDSGLPAGVTPGPQA
jgi:hypothetical protein